MYSTIDTTEPVARLEERAEQSADFLTEQARRLLKRLRKAKDRPNYHARLIAATSSMNTCAAMLGDLHQQERTAAIAEQLRESEIDPTLEPQHEGR